MVYVISIRSDILLCKRENCWELSGDSSHDIQKISTSFQNITFLYCGRDGEAIYIDDLVTFCGVDGQDGIHSLVHIFGITGGHINW